ncbi:MAG: hypothetical protein ACREBD_39100, partial [Blastocatellia bacterium]
MALVSFGKISFSLVLTGAILLSIFSTAGAQARRAPQPQNENQRSAGQRIAPPSSLKCPRNHLTAFMGRVSAYQRTQTR